MATKTAKKRGATGVRQGVFVETEGEGEVETEVKSEAEAVADEQIERLTATSPPATEALIYRADPSTGKEAFLDRVSPELISEEWVMRTYGGGKYRIQVRKPGENGRLVFGKQVRYEIDPAIPSKARMPASGAVSNADGSPAGGFSPGMDNIMQSGILALFNQMQNANQMVLTFVKEMAERRNEPVQRGPDMVALLGAIAPFVTPLLERLNAPAPVVVAPKDPIELAKQLLELRGKDQGGETPKGAVAQLKEVLELRELLSGLGGGEGEEDPMLKLVGMLGPQIIDAFKSAQAIDAAKATGTPAVQPPRPATARVAAPAPTMAPAPATTTTEPTAATGEATPMDMATAYIGSRLPKIIKLAEQGKNPDLYAQLEEDILPGAFKDAAREFVSQENFLEQIFASYPQLSEHKEWMEDFFDTFAAALLGELEADDDDLREEEELSAHPVDATETRAGDGGEVVRADIPADTSVVKGSRNGTVE